MNAMHFMVIAPLINNCPNCGSADVGPGYGVLNVSDNVIKRACNCGFEFEFDTSSGVNHMAIRRAINNAVEELKI